MAITLNGHPAEVITTTTVGDLEYVRLYIEDEGVKTVTIEDVEIEARPDPHDLPDTVDPTALHPDHEAVSAEWFDLRAQALTLEIAHQQGQLLSISNSTVRLEPYQLACVNWVMDKLRQRALIADDVGLGKTIEAGLILKELAARNRADRVLFIVPAHLQPKWERDMQRFFDFELTTADRDWVAGERRRLGEATNIWAQDDLQLLTSQAFLRQDEFQPALEEAFWDVVIIDEAHKAAKRGDSPSKTSKMAERVASNSDSLLLLSATPHDGKGEAFRSLVSYIDPFLVADDTDLTRELVDQVMIRRGKQSLYDDDGERIFPDREVNTVPIQMSSDESAFYEAVTEYVQTVYNRSETLNEPAVGFAMALMQKRLVSSVGAIKATLSRRLADLTDRESTATDLSADARAYLDGEDLSEADQIAVEEELAGLTVTESDAELETEIETLRDLIGMAESIPVDSKAQTVREYIQRLLEDNPNEKVLLFTEYRDTLEYLLELVDTEPWADEILTIHGDVDREQRSAIEEEFNHGRSRLLFATDAASEGIDLQESCHIMINYELPWNPNRLEQRIGRLHRYGQDKEVKVWNFSFSDTREGEIFELLQEKVETIRGQLGNTADVLGMLDDIDIEELLMDSIQTDQPASATKEELEAMIDERQQTLEEWYDRSLLDTTTFDEESRQQIQEVIDDSEAVYGSQADIKAFVTGALDVLGGSLEHQRAQEYLIEVPDALPLTEETYGPVTFSREYAMDNESLTFIAPGDAFLEALMTHVLEADRGGLGLKQLPFVDRPGIAFTYRLRFEDGTDEVIHEELRTVFVDSTHHDPRPQLGERIIEGDSIAGRPDGTVVSQLFSQRATLRETADDYISEQVTEVKRELHQRRQAETDAEIEQVESYAAAERERITEYLDEYERKADAGSDMDIAIRGQEQRLKKLEARIDNRKAELEAKARVISHAPVVEAVCMALPV